jgi:hypothetical protein
MWEINVKKNDKIYVPLGPGTPTVSENEKKRNNDKKGSSVVVTYLMT